MGLCSVKVLAIFHGEAAEKANTGTYTDSGLLGANDLSSLPSLPPTAKTKPARVSCGWKPKHADVFLSRVMLESEGGSRSSLKDPGVYALPQPNRRMLAGKRPMSTLEPPDME